jgi:23S rRNA pseudouridine1911/1915/1917 synthase
VARTPLAYASLVEQLSGRTASRTYGGVVWGHPDPPRGVVDAPIGRSPREPTRMAVVAGGREARTRYAVVHELMEPLAAAVVTCELETGRTHQIRVHMAAIGHPIVGDGAYGGVRDGVTTARPMLHAEQLAFDHPRTGERLTFTAPVPDDMTAVLARFH